MLNYYFINIYNAKNNIIKPLDSKSPASNIISNSKSIENDKKSKKESIQELLKKMNIKNISSSLNKKTLFTVEEIYAGICRFSAMFYYDANNVKTLEGLRIISNTREDMAADYVNISIGEFLHSIKHQLRCLISNAQNDLFIFNDYGANNVILSNYEVFKDVIYMECRQFVLKINPILMAGDYTGNLLNSLLDQENPTRLFSISYNRMLNNFEFTFIGQMDFVLNDIKESLLVVLKIFSNEFFENSGKFVYYRVCAVSEVANYNIAKMLSLMSWKTIDSEYILTICKNNIFDEKKDSEARNKTSSDDKKKVSENKIITSKKDKNITDLINDNEQKIKVTSNPTTDLFSIILIKYKQKDLENNILNGKIMYILENEMI
jgi:hypothetical protein